jgi:hypothetical protein
MADLSPAAQAVKDSVLSLYGDQRARDMAWPIESLAAAAALVAAAGTVPKETFGGENYAAGFNDGITFSCQFLHDLAAELDSTPITPLEENFDVN